MVPRLYKMPPAKPMKARLSQQRAAVHHQRLAGHVRSAVAGQQQRHLGHLARLAEVLEGLPADDFSLPRFVLPVIFAEHRLNESRRNRVHAHAFGSEFARVALRHHDKRCFGHAVQQAVGLRPQPGNRRDIDNGARAALAHPRSHQLYQEERTLQIDFDHLVELPFIYFEARPLRDICRCVVHKDVYAPELANGRVNQVSDLVHLADMAGNGLYAWADFTRHRVEGFLLASADDDFCASRTKTSAMALPMPRLAPVTIATLSLRMLIAATLIFLGILKPSKLLRSGVSLLPGAPLYRMPRHASRINVRHLYRQESHKMRFRG